MSGSAGKPDYQAVLESTWPAARTRRLGPWTLRDGEGGGKRVSAATAGSPVTRTDLDQAERAMIDQGQRPLFMIRPDEPDLDRLLATAGYTPLDPTMLYAAPIDAFTQEPLPRVSAYYVWPLLAIMVDIWAEGGIGPERIAIMDRAVSPKTAILARHTDQPAGTAFVSIVKNIAMIHAIEVSAKLRRQGVGGNILRAAAFWAQDQGATHLSLAVTEANAGARALYTSFAMQVVGRYHYRVK